MNETKVQDGGFIDPMNPYGFKNARTVTDPIDDIEPTQKPRIEASEKWLVWDIETAPQPEEQLLASMPKFEPAANLKDPEKIKASIEEKKARYIAQAALTPFTGRVIAVGFQFSHEPEVLIHGEDEYSVVSRACMILTERMLAREQCVGFNIHGFDLPFLRFRAMVHKIPTPHWINRAGRAYWTEKFRDILPELVMGRDFTGYSVGAVGNAFGLGGKNGDGALFYETYKKDKKAALDYLSRDLTLTGEIAKRMGVIV